MKKENKVVITGGAGFIGSHIADELVSQGTQVIIIDNLSTGSLENIRHLTTTRQVEFICDNILNLQLLQKLFNGVDYVFHEAAIPGVPQSIDNPLDSNEINITGTLNVLIAAKNNRVRKVIFASSSAVYGNEPILPKKESAILNLDSPYAATKLAGEHYCEVFNRVYGLSTASLRYFNVYGQRQNPDSEYAAVIPKFIDRIKRGEKPQIYGDGEQTRDFVYIKDVVAANILIAQSDAVGVFNIGSGKKVTLNTLLGMITRLLNRSSIKPLYMAARPGDIKHSFADITKAQNATGYRPKYNLLTGLKEMLSM